MKKEIEAIIKKNLPQEVGEVLKERLEQADLDAALLENTKEQLKDMTEKYSKLDTRLSKYISLSEKEETLKAAQKKLESDQRELEVTILTLKLSESEKRADVITGFIDSLTRNVTYRRNIVDSFTDGQPVIDGQGNAMYPIPTHKNLTETKTEE